MFKGEDMYCKLRTRIKLLETTINQLRPDAGKQVNQGGGGFRTQKASSITPNALPPCLSPESLKKDEEQLNQLKKLI